MFLILFARIYLYNIFKYYFFQYFYIFTCFDKWNKRKRQN